MAKIGDCVVFVDPVGVEHLAFVTEVWDGGNPDANPNASVNLVYVSDDVAERDQYGRQIKRNTSVVHATNQYAHGMYWREARPLVP